MTFKSHHSPGSIGNICVNMHQFWWFLYCFRGGWHLWTPFSQPFFDKTNMFLCSLERKFPGKFKTHPTFISSPLPKAQNIIYKKIPLFRGKPFSSLKMASYQLKCINYQMDHIWLAPSSLNKSLDLKLGSQWSNTLYRSFVVTLYVCVIFSKRALKRSSSSILKSPGGF